MGLIEIMKSLVSMVKKRITEHRDRKYDIVAYDPAWPEMFAREVEKLAATFGKRALAFEHVGSTAVFGMSGKPTIDILIFVESIEGLREAVDAGMANRGYDSLGEYVRPGALLFAKEKDNARVFNVHVMPKSHPEAENMIAFRDYLRSHPDDAAEYSKVKLELFRKYPDDYFSYRSEKDAYLKILKAKIWA